MHQPLSTLLRIGHRGACGHAPENTLASMQKALLLGVDGVEFDIQMSKDGVPVVIHDETLERTTNGKGRVSDYTVAELKQFDAGNGEKIPTLAELMDFVDRRCDLLVELKDQSCEMAVAEMLRAGLAKGWKLEQFIVCAFDHPQLARLKARHPEFQVAALIAGIPASLAAMAEEIGAYAFNPCIHHISQALVDDAHKRGLKVFTWTANEPHDVAKAKALGVDGIISNYPDRLKPI